MCSYGLLEASWSSPVRRRSAPVFVLPAFGWLELEVPRGVSDDPVAGALCFCHSSPSPPRGAGGVSFFCGLSSEAYRARVCTVARSGLGCEMQRVAVFIDWQNAYQQARAAFGLTGSGHEGQFSPLRLGQLLAARNRRGKDGRLGRVEGHRGQPLSNVDPIGHAAVALQAQAWKAEAPGVVVAQLRPLAKQDDGKFVEKGV